MIMHIDIAQNNIIQLYEDIPLDSDYINTFYFASESAQNTFFSGTSHLKKTINNATYIREERNAINVPYKVGEIYTFNYMRFKNVAQIDSVTTDYFENKWYYAFIDRVEYVNNLTARIYYTIDVMQTWLHGVDYTFNYCFIKRQHVTSDEIGENLQPENLSIGDVVISSQYYDSEDHQMVKFIRPDMDETILHDVFYDCEWCIVFMFKGGLLVDFINRLFETFTPPNSGYSWFVKHRMQTGIYQGLYFISFPLNDQTQTYVDSLIALLGATTMGGLESIFLCPSAMCPLTPVQKEGESDELFAQREERYYSVKDNTNSFTEIEGYAINGYFGNHGSGATDGRYYPLNNKMFTYPYKYTVISNNRGENRTYKYEFFEDNVPYFAVEGNFSAQPSLMCYPLDYKNRVRMYDDKCTISNLPQCSGSYPNFVDWLAKGAMLGVGIATENIPLMVAGATYKGQIKSLNAKKAMATTEEQKTSINNQIKDIELQRENASERELKNLQRGLNNLPNPFIEKAVTISNGDILFGNNYTKLFTLIAYEITKEYAEKIDMYFSKFGYTINKVDLPNITARPLFTYIETDGCVLHTNKMPHNAERAICNIIDKGITFWKDPSKLGVYSRENLVANQIPSTP